MSRLSQIISPKLMQEVNDSQSFSLKIPEDAKRKGTGKDARYTWTEQLKVIGSKVYVDPKHENTLVYEVQYKVADDSAVSLNVGKSFTVWYRVDSDAMNGSDKAAGRYKMSVNSIGRLKSLVRACGQDIPEGAAVDLVPYFDTSEYNETPEVCVVGYEIYAKLTDRPDEDADGNPVRKQEPSLFTPLADGA